MMQLYDLQYKRFITNTPSHQMGGCPQKQFSYYHKVAHCPLYVSCEEGMPYQHEYDFLQPTARLINKIFFKKCQLQTLRTKNAR